MKNYKLLSLALTASFLTISGAEARSYDNIIRPYQSARAAAMGGVRYSTGLFDENFFANPARMVDNPHWRRVGCSAIRIRSAIASART